MRCPVLARTVSCVSLVLTPAVIAAQSGGGVSATIHATAAVAPRTSLQVPARVLEFEVAPGATEALAVVDFTTAVRARPGANVWLTIEATSGVVGPGGPADAQAELTITGGAEGALPGVMSLTGPVPAARWSGGGVRAGRLVFRLRASPGSYSVPVRFAISVP
jgi:hypothetical protein